MSAQDLIIAIIVLLIIMWQLKTFKSLNKIIVKLSNFFPEKDKKGVDLYLLKESNSDDDTTVICKPIDVSYSEDFDGVVNDINSYLGKNKNKTFDYQIIKDIVDRDIAPLGDEVDTMLPVPLYLGLIATMFGVSVGILSFAFQTSNGLSSTDISNIIGLLIDVGIAMFASLCGIFLTKKTTSRYNSAKVKMEKSKNSFLTWIQSELMPKYNEDITGAIVKMTNDLNTFNSSFANNTANLRITLQAIQAIAQSQAAELEAIRKLDVSKIASANIQVYDKLQGCTEALGKLVILIANSETYVSKVTELNDSLGAIEDRIKLSEDLGAYFKEEMNTVKECQGMVREGVSSLDSVMKEAFKDLGDDVKKSLQDLKSIIQTQTQDIQAVFEGQKEDIAESLKRQKTTIDNNVNQLKDGFGDVNKTYQDGLDGMKSKFDEQNKILNDALTRMIEDFTKAISKQQESAIIKMGSLPDKLSGLDKLAALDKLDTIDKIDKSIEKLNNTISKLSNSINSKKSSKNTDGESTDPIGGGDTGGESDIDITIQNGKSNKSLKEWAKHFWYYGL